MSSPQPWHRELQVAEELARAAGALILRYHRTGVEVERKEGNEPVTRADRESSELILAGLRRAFPDDVLISEEEPDDPARLRGGRVWFVDPLDGTSDFVRGDEGFSVMIGLVVDARPRVGVVFQPIGGRLYAASPDGARFVDADGERPLRVSAVDDLLGARLVVSKSHRDATMDRVKKALGVTNEFNIGSVGLKLGLIARAERDLYVHPSSKSKAWDTCAPEAILAAAGGRLTDVHGQPLAYDLPDLWNAGGLVATNGHLHDTVIERLAPLFPPGPLP